MARSVEGCLYACKDCSGSESSLSDLSKSATEISKALNDVIIHIKGGTEDKIPEIMEGIILTSDQICSSNDAGEQIAYSRTIAQATSDLIQALKAEADATSDVNMKVNGFNISFGTVHFNFKRMVPTSSHFIQIHVLFLESINVVNKRNNEVNW